jgi:hypothetical protein
MTLVDCIKAIQEDRATKFTRGCVTYCLKGGRVKVYCDGKPEVSSDIHGIDFLISNEFYLVDEIPKGYTRKGEKFVRTKVYKRYLKVINGSFESFTSLPSGKVYTLEIPVEVEYPD